MASIRQFYVEASMRSSAILVTCFLLAAARSAVSSADEPGQEQIREAIAKSLPLLEKSARGSMEYVKQCFNCHNQGLPILTMVAAHERGFAMDAEHLQLQL